MVKHLKLRFSGGIINRTQDPKTDFAVFHFNSSPTYVFTEVRGKYPDIMIKIQISQPNARTKSQKKQKKKSGHEFNTDGRTLSFKML